MTDLHKKAIEQAKELRAYSAERKGEIATITRQAADTIERLLKEVKDGTED